MLIGLIHTQRGEHQPIALIGGATGKIGDPSGKTKERQLLENDVIDKNLISITSQIQNVFNNHREYFWNDKKGPLCELQIVNNADWYKDINFLDFISKVGRHFRMGQMLSRSSVQSRMENEEGMSFTEFTYQIFQAYDWLELFKNYNCHFQLGGTDQMGNIMTGCELITRVLKKQVFGITMPLITNEEGDKFGKTAKNAVWLDKNKTSEFSFYQFFLRQPDTEAEKLLNFFSFLPSIEIIHLIEKHKRFPELRIAQKAVAEQLTLLIHGIEGLTRAKNISEALYSGNANAIGELNKEDVKEIFSGAPYRELIMEPGTKMIEAAMLAQCFRNKDDAERIIAAGGFQINMKKTTNPSEILAPDVHILPNGISLFRVGKKNYSIIKWI